MDPINQTPILILSIFVLSLSSRLKTYCKCLVQNQKRLLNEINSYSFLFFSFCGETVICYLS